MRNFILILLMAGSITLSLTVSAQDNTAPQLTDLSVSPVTSTGNDLVTIDLSILEEGSGMDFLELFISDPNGNEKLSLSRDQWDGLQSPYSFSFTVSPYWINGTWSISKVILNDKDGNDRFLMSADLASFSNTFEVSGNTPDQDPPQLNTASFNPASIDAGQSTTLELNITDDLSGLTYGYLEITNSDNEVIHALELTDFIENLPNNYQYTFQTELAEATGTWKLNSLTLRDLADNSITLDESALTTALSVQGDDLPPALNDISIAPASPVTTGESVYIDLWVSDDLSGFSKGHLVIEDPEARLKTYNFSTAELAGIDQYQIEIVVGQWDPLNQYQIVEIQLEDQVGKTNTLTTTDFKKQSYKVINTTPDLAAPVVDQVAVTPNPVNAGENLEVTLTVTDDISGLHDFEVVLSEENENDQFVLSKVDFAENGSIYTASIPIEYDNFSGNWKVASITTSDMAGNEFTYQDGTDLAVYFEITGTDMEAPQLVTFNYNPVNLDAGHTITINLQASDDVTGIVDKKLTINEPVSGKNLIIAQEDWLQVAEDSYRTEITINSFAPSGTYHFSLLSLTDSIGRNTTLQDLGTFEVNQPAVADLVPPVIDGVELTGDLMDQNKVIEAGNRLVFSMSISDNISGVDPENIYVLFEHETADESFYFNDFEKLSSIDFRSEFLYSNSLRTGTWNLKSIYVFDLAGNATFADNYSKYFELTGTSVIDRDPPVINSVALNPTTAGGGQTIDLIIEASDPSGIFYLDGIITNAAENSKLSFDSNLASISSIDNDYTITIPIEIPQMLVDDDYLIETIEIYDQIGNSAKYIQPDDFISPVLTITGNSSPFVFVENPDDSTAVNSELVYAFPANSFLDPDPDDQLTYTASLADESPLPAWIVFDAIEFKLTATPGMNDIGTLEIKITATDLTDQSSSDYFYLTVTNNSPTVAIVPEQTVITEGEVLDLLIDRAWFNDPDPNDQLSFEVLNGTDPLPEWLSFDGSKLSGTPGENDPGNYTLTIIASDLAGNKAETALEIKVLRLNAAPSLAQNIADQEAITGGAYAFTLPDGTFTDPDPEDIQLSYSSTLANDEALPGWLTFNTETTTWNGTPANTDQGNFTVKIIASDEFGAIAFDEFILTVSANQAPQLDNPVADQKILAGQEWNWNLPDNTFSDPNQVDEITITASLENGDPLPEWLTFDGITFNGIPQNADAGSVNLKITAADPNGGIASDIFTLTVEYVNQAPLVANQIPDQKVAGNDVWSFVVPETTFEDPDQDELTLTAMLNDGSALPEWLSFDPTGPAFSGTIVNTAQIITIKVIAADPSGLEATSTFDLTIEEVNVAPEVSAPIPDQMITAGEKWTFMVPADVFTDTNSGDQITLSASLADDSILPAWLIFNSSTNVFSGTPVNSDIESIDIKVTATDLSGASANDVFKLTVTPQNNPPQLAQELNAQTVKVADAWSFAVPVGTFTDPDSWDEWNYKADLSDGSLLPGWISFNPGNQTFSGTPANGDEGVFNVRVTVTDLSGAAAHTEFQLTVSGPNKPPVIAGEILSKTIKADSEWQYQIPQNAFSDPDQDQLSFEASKDDGSALPAWLNFEPGTAILSGTPQNADAGTISIKISATDPSGASVSQVFELTIEEINHAPVAEGTIENSEIIAGSFLDVTFADNLFTDQDPDDILEISLMLVNELPLPDWMKFDANTMNINGLATQNEIGEYTLELIAIDPDGASAKISFTITVVPNQVTALEDEIAGLQMYPNPVENYLQVRWDFQANSALLQITDMTGRTVVQKSISGTQIELDVNGLKKGIYFLKIISEHQRLMKKFIKK